MKPSRMDYMDYLHVHDSIEYKINECYRMFACYIHILKNGYGVSEEEIRKGFDNIMKGGRPWASTACAQAPAVAHNADSKA